MPTVDNALQTNTGATALSTTEAGVISGTGVPLLEQGPGRVTPPALAFAYIPQITGLAAGASVTLNLRAGTTIAGTIFGSATITNSGAGSASVGPLIAVGLVPPGTENLFPCAVASSGTPSASGSATAPVIAGALYLT